MKNLKKENIKFIINIILPSVFIISLLFISILNKDKDISISERRKLKQMPTINSEAIFSNSNSFMKQFDEYTLDQFPSRELFRNINSIANKYLLLK